MRWDRGRPVAWCVGDDLSGDLRAALDEKDDESFDQARVRADAECGDHDEFEPDPQELVEIACGIAEVPEPGPRPEVALTNALVAAAAALDKQYEGLSKAAFGLVIDPDAPRNTLLLHGSVTLPRPATTTRGRWSRTGLREIPAHAVDRRRSERLRAR